MFTRTDTKVVKGMAVILMFIHHLWGFPDRLPGGMQLRTSGILLHGTGFLSAVGGFGKICVAVFMFLGGYGLWQKMQREYSLAKDIQRLYFTLWKIAVIFIPIGFLFFSNQTDYAADSVICHVFEDRSIGNILNNFLGLSSTYNREWWFFLSFLGAMTVGYIFISVDKTDNFWVDAFLVVLIEIITQRLLPAICEVQAFTQLRSDFFFRLFFVFDRSVCVFFVGIVFAKYDAVVRLRKYYQNMIISKAGRIAVGCIGLGVIFWCRTFSLGGDFDMIYVPVFIVFLLEIVDAVEPLGRLLVLFGKHSGNMWLIHGFYCYYFYSIVKIVCWSGNAYVALFTLLVLAFFSSVAVNRIWNEETRIAGRLAR